MTKIICLVGAEAAEAAWESAGYTQAIWTKNEKEGKGN